MTDIDLVPLIDEGLGNSAYLVDLGDGRALVVDVSRDLRAVYEAAARRGLTVAFAADTHLHADFLSGAHQLGATNGTKVLASAAGDRAFAHTGLHDGDEVDLGGLRLRALLTPGHTHEHLAFLLLDGDREIGVFTGGSLIVGSAARTDLISDLWIGPVASSELESTEARSWRVARTDDASAVETCDRRMVGAPSRRHGCPVAAVRRRPARWLLRPRMEQPAEVRFGRSRLVRTGSAVWTGTGLRKASGGMAVGGVVSSRCPSGPRPARSGRRGQPPGPGRAARACAGSAPRGS